MRSGLVALAAICVACSASHGTPASSGSASSGSGSASAVAEVISDGAGVTANLGKHVALRGRAGNAKLGAVVMVDGPIYCLGVDRWPPELDGKDVVAHGTLESSHQFEAKPGPNGEINQGTDGPVIVLRDCTYDAP